MGRQGTPAGRLAFASVSAIGAAHEPQKPRLRGWFHTVAFFASLPSGAALVLLARGASARVTAAVYAAALTAVFAASAAYHRVRWSAAARRRMKRLDHSMIFLLIAGTYTPVCVLALRGAWAIALLALVWAGAAVGIALKLARIDGLRVPTAVLYVGLGWLAVLALPMLLRALPPAASVLMVIGGVLYTVGAVVLARRRPDPAPATFGYHEVWHAFMVAAAGCHYAMVLLIVRMSG
jgi:hemolysin III